MINNPLIVFLNTQGVLIFIGSVLIYEFFILRKKEVTSHAVFAVVTVFIVSVLLKELYLVPRPFTHPGVASYAGLARLSSFPSLHAALAFGLATTVALHQRRFGIFLLVIAAMISVGRVAAYVHYPIDIAFGILIGVLVGLFFDRMHFRARRKH